MARETDPLNKIKNRELSLHGFFNLNYTVTGFWWTSEISHKSDNNPKFLPKSRLLLTR
jgi:hypothetical protein